MGKRRRDPESDGTASASGLKAIFVSTSLDTHLAMTLSLSDTVADFTRKIMLQHEQCFPETGPLTIHSLKLEHQGKMFQLVSDTVISIAFEGCEGRWDLFVDASTSLEVLEEQNDLVPCIKDKLESPRLPLAIDANTSKSHGEISQQSLDVEKDLSSKDDSKIENDKLPLRKSFETTRSVGGLNSKKKQKVEHSLVAAGVATRTSPQTTMSTRSNNEAGGLEDSDVHASPKVSTDVLLGGRDVGASPHNIMFSDAKTFEQVEPESRVCGNDAPSIRSRVSYMETKSLEKSVVELKEYMTSPDVPSLQIQEEQPAISTSTTKKSKRKKKHKETNSSVPRDNAATSKLGTVFQGSVVTEEACEGQILVSGNHGMVNDGNLQNTDDKEDGHLSSNHKAGLSENDKPPDSVEKTTAVRETVICIGMVDKFREADEIKNSKKSSTKSAVVQGQVYMEHAKEHEHPMDQPDEEQKNTEKKKRKKKAKRAGNSTGDGLGIPEVNQENVGDEELASLVEKSTDLKYTDGKRTVDQSGVTGLGLGKNSDIKDTNENEQILQNSDSPDVPAHEIESNHEDIHATNNGLASEGEGEKGSVNFRRYFVPGDDHRGASTDKIEGESNVLEGAEKANEQTIVPEGKRRPSKSSGNHKTSSGISTVAKSHERPLKEKQSKSVSEMGNSTSSTKRLKSLSTTKDANVKALKKSVDPARVTVPHRLEKNNGPLISSNIKSASRDSKKTLLIQSNQKKQTGINIKKTAEGKISGKKDLLTTAGKLFGNDSSSSEDENGQMKSGSSTQSPSYSSSSSESEDLMTEGSNNNHGKTPFGSKLANPRNMSMDMIMRSSNRFKKAKLTASQSEADSQQVDFVPETQP